MRRTTWRRTAALLLLAVGTAVAGLVAASPASPASPAATPGSGSVSAAEPEVTWSGGPFLAINPIVTTDCAVPDAPFCDTFDLTVGALDPTRPDVVVTVAGDQGSDLYHATVYGPDGTLLHRADGIGTNHRFVLVEPAAGTYSVRVELLLGVPGASTYSGRAFTADADAPVDVENACDVPVEDTSVVLDPDDGRRVFLDVLVLLDGVPEESARAFFEKVAVPYDALNLGVRATYQVADPPFTGTETLDILNQARQRFPDGKVPPEYDIVEVLTSKDLTLAGQTAIAGQADCLGGLAYDDRSYNVSEGPPEGSDDTGIAIGPFTFVADIYAKITAHEIGHLLGGQHHYGNCVEGNNPDEELNGDTSPCTLMFNAADFISLDFGEVNGRIARGYALRYAAANDTFAPPNRPPVARDDTASTHRNRAVMIDVLANDGDEDGDPLTIVAAGPPDNGTARVVDGGIEYDPRKGFGGADTFTYTISDGRGGEATATVAVDVGPTPPRGGPA